MMHEIKMKDKHIYENLSKYWMKANNIYVTKYLLTYYITQEGFNE